MKCNATLQLKWGVIHVATEVKCKFLDCNRTVMSFRLFLEWSVYLATKMRCDSSCDRRCDSHRCRNELVQTLSCIIHMATDNSWTLYKCVGLATYVCIQLSDVMFCEKWVTDRHCGNGGRGVPFFSIANWNCSSGIPGLLVCIDFVERMLFFIYFRRKLRRNPGRGWKWKSNSFFLSFFPPHFTVWECRSAVCIFKGIFQTWCRIWPFICFWQIHSCSVYLCLVLRHALLWLACGTSVCLNS